ncbi:hypothetical protein [Kitasatospora sp. NPDC048538]|uniref:hypothetical protein n=1 Tax=unclassified Kitasatospora TaxID=2633591 RepID=UPI0033DD89CB
MKLSTFKGSSIRRTASRAALVVGAAATALGLTATAAVADTTAANFTLSQPNWRCGESRISGNTRLTFQCDGNLVLYYGGQALWASGTYWGNYIPTQVDWSQSGYIILIDDFGHHLCTIGATNSAPGGRARIQDDGNFVFYKTNGGAAWASNTYGAGQGNVDYCHS